MKLAIHHFVRRIALGTLLAALPFTGAAAEDAPYRLEALGDTVLQALGDDQYSARSASAKPSLNAFAGQTIQIRIEAADASTASAQALGFGVEVSEVDPATGASVSGTSGTFTLTFKGETTSAFDGRFLVARDLVREQSYRPEAAWSGAERFEYALYRGGVKVAAYDSDGVAPFVLDRAPDAFSGGPRALPGGDEEIAIHSFSWGATATSDTGESFAVDTVEVRGHELGHLLGLGHTHRTGARNVWMLGVEEALVEIELE